MPKKFLIWWDKILLGLDRVATKCKSARGKLLNTLALIDACCTIVAFLGNDELKSITFLKTSYYDTLVSHFPEIVKFLSVPAGKLVFGLASLSIIITYLFRWFYRQPALVIAHSTMGHDLSVLETSFRKSFYIKRVNINHTLPPQDARPEDIIAALKTQDKAVDTIKQTNWRSNVFYYGVTHTPLIFRLGYQFGQTQRIRLLHRFRSTGNAQEFKELPEYDNDKVALVSSRQQDEIDCNRKRELLVALGTTYSIIDEDLRTIDPDNEMYIYKVQLDDKTRGFDFFNSYHKIHSYADRFAEDIRNLVKEKNIDTIHMVISSSAPFTFYLAQQMNTNQYPKIIVYHYDHGKYTWGIAIQEKDPSKAITWVQTLPIV